MKKLFSVFMVAALTVLSTIPASAATQTVTVDIPARDYSYTMVIPQDCTLEYGNTTLQSIGTGRVTSDHWNDILADYDGVSVKFDDGALTNEGGHTIRTYWEAGYTEEQTSNTGGLSFRADSDFFAKVQVSDWSGAEAGTRYTMTITYTAHLHPKMDID